MALVGRGYTGVVVHAGHHPTNASRLTSSAAAGRDILVVPKTKKEPRPIHPVHDHDIKQKVTLAIGKNMLPDPDITNTGRQALALLAGNTYRPILMGLQTTRIIRTQNACALNHDLPIIPMTAHNAENYQHSCQNTGMNDYICNPVNSSKLCVCTQRMTSMPDPTA